MKKVVQLSLSLMLILPVATSCATAPHSTVEPKESKTVEPSTLNTIQTIRLQPQTAILEQLSAYRKLKGASVEQDKVDKVAPVKKTVAVKPTTKAKTVETVKKTEVASKKVNVVKTSAETNTTKSTVAKKLDTHLDGELAGKGTTFAQSAKENNVDPYLIAAIAIHETGNGTSTAVRNKNNVGGLMGKNGLKRFSSVDSSIEYLSNLIEEKYVANGRETIRAISYMYAPVGADNDPNGLNANWVSGVRSIYNKLKGTSL